MPVQNPVLLDEEAYEADVAARAVAGIGVRPLDEILDADPADEPLFVLEVVVERLSRDMGSFAYLAHIDFAVRSRLHALEECAGNALLGVIGFAHNAPFATLGTV